MKDEEMAHGEIIIVRRGGGGHEDEHHGGVWKIAFADFMTAMMAFFLVMWLINASNEETKKAVASYFNPVKLMDTTSNPKGVRSPKYGNPSDESVEEDESTQITKPSSSANGDFESPKSFDEQALFIDPYAVLAEIAGGLSGAEGAKRMAEENKAVGEGGGNMGLTGGASFQDPFDPTSWSMQHGEPLDQNAAEAPKFTDQSEEPGESEPGSMNLEQAELDEPAKDAMVGDPEPTKMAKAETSAEEMKPEPGSAEMKPADAEMQEAVEKQTAEVTEALAKLKREEDLSGLDLQVMNNGQGTVISLSDESANGMFNIGSAQPTPNLVNIMAKIGAIIDGKSGRIAISGHTDGRKYQSEDYDNWRLSTARAHMAYYMLVRGGLSEDKVERIEGQADKKLKVPDQPFAAANRRIEVLLSPQ